MESNIIVLGAEIVGGLFVLRVIWNVAVKRLLKHSSFDGVEHGDGTGSIWQ